MPASSGAFHARADQRTLNLLRPLPYLNPPTFRPTALLPPPSTTLFSFARARSSPYCTSQARYVSFPLTTSKRCRCLLFASDRTQTCSPPTTSHLLLAVHDHRRSAAHFSSRVEVHMVVRASGVYIAPSFCIIICVCRLSASLITIPSHFRLSLPPPSTQLHNFITQADLTTTAPFARKSKSVFGNKLHTRSLRQLT